MEGERTDTSGLERDRLKVRERHVPADLELEDLDEQDARRGEEDDERVLGRRDVEVRDVRLVKVLSRLDVLEPVLTESLAFLVWLQGGTRSASDPRSINMQGSPSRFRRSQ